MKAVKILPVIIETVYDLVRKEIQPKLAGHIKADINSIAEYIKDFYPLPESELKSKSQEAAWAARIKTMLYAFPDGIVPEKHEPYFSFIIFCKYLGIDISADVIAAKGLKYKFNSPPEEVIDKLRFKKLISPELAAQQMLLLGENRGLGMPDYFTCFLSQGKNAPISFKLTLYFKSYWAELTMDDGKVLEGSLKYPDGALFIHLNDDVTGYESFLYLNKQGQNPVETANTFIGAYVSAPANEFQTSAVKAIVSRDHTADNVIEPKTEYELYDEVILQKKTVRFSTFQKYVGVYQGYWFEVGVDLFLIRTILQIEPSGKCTISGANDETMWGELTDVNENGHFLTVRFSYIEGGAPSMNIIFDLRTYNKNYFDGVYSGHKSNFQILSGKTRIYKLGEQSTKEPAVFSKNEIIKAEPEIGLALLDFFIGRNGAEKSSKYLQPNLTTFDKWFNPRLIETTRPMRHFNGSYMMLRLDSAKTHINRYKVNIKEGIVTFELIVRDGTRYFSGNAVSINSCLMLNLNLRNEEPYDALYIFHIFGAPTRAINYFNGVYATTTYLSNPICGRAVLFQADNTTEYTPITLFSDEYYLFDEQNDNALQLLTGTENNMIKVNRHEKTLGRVIEYGDLFFNYLCNTQKDINKALYVRFALDNGFKDVDKLDHEVNYGCLTSLKGKVICSKSEQKENFRHVTVIYLDKHSKPVTMNYDINIVS